MVGSVMTAFTFREKRGKDSEKERENHLELQIPAPVEDGEIITISTVTWRISKISHRQWKHVTRLMKERLSAT